MSNVKLCNMSKLFKLKEWLTLLDSARHLSIAFGEDVNEADVLRLALDGHLKLSVNFVNKARAKCGEVILIADAQYREFSADLVASIPGLSEEAKGKPVMVLQGLNIDDKRVLELDSEVISLDGVWDLPMIGAEQLDIEHEYQNLTGGPAVTLINLEGAFVERVEGRMCQLQDSFDPREINTPQGKKKLDRSYYPAGGLPQDAVIVVRTAALREFEQAVNGVPEAIEKPLGAKERNSLLTIIAALCDYSAIDLNGREAVAQIEAMTDEIAAPVGNDTIRTAIKQIPDALESRKK